MFEQESYNAVTQVESQDGNLFHNYEVKNWVFSPTLYKILAVSAVLNLSVLAFIGQTNLLTRRGCDSPFVGRVCQVLDMAYVGTVLFGTEREYVDMEYEKTDLGDAEITYIDVSGEAPPLYYPENYFRLANPVEYAASQQPASDSANLTNSFGTNIPGFSMPRNNDSDLLNQRATPPTPNPNVFQDDGNTNPFKVDNGTNAGVRRKPRNRPSVTPADDPKKDKKDADDAVAATRIDPQPTPDPQDSMRDPITGNTLNSRPWKNLRVAVKETIAKGGLDLQTSFTLKANVKLTKDGKIDENTIRYSEVIGDKKLIKIVQDALAAFSDSGQLQVLKELSGKDLNFAVTQDEVNVSAVVQSELENEERAKAVKSSLDLLIVLAKTAKSGTQADENDKLDLALLEKAVIEANGKKIIIKFDIPKDMAHQMVQKMLEDKPADPKKPSGNAEVRPVNNAAMK